MAPLKNPANDAVRVALRIRPQSADERTVGARVCTAVPPDVPQVTVSGDRSFTFDFVFDTPTPQEDVYRKCVADLVEGTFHGFNATVLAYGQTGSGKTHTMGTAFGGHSTSPDNTDVGIIPRAAQHIFEGIERRRAEARDRDRMEPSFDVTVQFVELYNEEIVDLLAGDRRTAQEILIQEDQETKEIVVKGTVNRVVRSVEDVLTALRSGAQLRATAATNLNAQSSRSHAIFTVSVRQQRLVPLEMGLETTIESRASTSTTTTTTSDASERELETLHAKFHFVDLAGSERLKKTGATGDRAREGISINRGLLTLGNVISALGTASGKPTHVAYRESKLTRMLQDSLGGNSRTLMIACVSPNEADAPETLNTLNYANRAKNIQNRVVANQDKSSKMIAGLRARIAELEAQLNTHKQGDQAEAQCGTEPIDDQHRKEQENVQPEVKHEVAECGTEPMSPFLPFKDRLRKRPSEVKWLRPQQQPQQMPPRRPMLLGPAIEEREVTEAAPTDADEAEAPASSQQQEVVELRSKLLERDTTIESLQEQLKQATEIFDRLQTWRSKGELEEAHMREFAGQVAAWKKGLAQAEQLRNKEAVEHRRKRRHQEEYVATSSKVAKTTATDES